MTAAHETSRSQTDATKAAGLFGLRSLLEKIGIREPGSPTPMSARPLLIWLLLGAIVLLAAALRLYALTRWSFWFDEGYDTALALLPPKEIISVSADGIHPPLYHLFLHYWMEVFGVTEYSIRLFSAVTGILAVIVVYFIAREIWDVEAGLVAAFVAACSPFLVAYSQEVRMYSLMFLWVSLSALFLVLAVKRVQNGWWVGYVVCSVAALYTNTGAFWFLVATNLYFLIGWRQIIRKEAWVIAQAAVALCYSPWLPVLREQSARVGLATPGIRDALEVVVSVNSLHFPLGVANLLYVAAILALVTLLPRRDDPYRSLAASWFATPIVLSSIVSLFKSVFLLRNLITASIGYHLLVARVVTSFSRPAIAILVLLPLVAMNAKSLQLHYDTSKSDWRSAARYLSANSADSDLIITTPGWQEPPLAFYLDEGPSTRGYPADSALVHEDDRGYANPSDVARGYSDIWVVSVSPDPQLIAYLDANGSKTDEQQFDGVRLLKYRLRSAP